MNYYWLFLILLFAIAILYSSVGHGGASGYIAIMVLFGLAPTLIKSSALILNILVSGIAFLQYYKGGYFKWKLFLPFAIGSIPASFIGSYLIVDDQLYKKILAILLVFPIIRLLGFIGKENTETKESNFFLSILIGILIGLLSGMIGIGGGIILSPLIILLHWGNMKQTAAVSALFIFVNSIAGLTGFLLKGQSIDPIVWGWMIIALTGGLLGSYLGRRKFSNLNLKRILALTLIIASVKLLMA